jgi:Tfp pilus assembly protein PilF
MICMFLIVSSLLVYGQVLNHDFINFDDGKYVTENPPVKAGLTRESIVWAFTTQHDGNWFPLTWLSHMLDCELYGLNPMGHHWTNLQIHIANAVLLFLVFNWMTGALWQSGLIAVLFAIHPLHVESVAWVSERKDVLCALFWILSMWAYVRYVRDPTKTRYLIIVLFFALGLMAKPMLVTLPFALLLLDFWPLSRFQPVSKKKASAFLSFFALVWEKVPLFVLSAASSTLTFFVQQHGGNVATLNLLPLEARTANAFVSYLSYLVKTVWPRKLALYYPHTKIISSSQIILSVAFVICLTLLVFWAARRLPYLLTGWLWYLGTLFPVIGLVQVGFQRMADRYTYIPLIGIFIIVAWGISDITARWRHRKIILTVIPSVVLGALMICTWFQVRHWQNTLTIFKHTLNVTHNNSVAHYKVAYVLAQNGKLDEAITHYSKSLEIDPRYSMVHHDFGVALVQKGKAQKAVYHFEKALQLDPEYALAHYNLGKVYQNQGNTEAEISHYRYALRINPDMTLALYHLSWILATHEKATYRNSNEALKLAERLCMLTNYQQPLALDALAAAYAEAGQYKNAVVTAQKAYNMALQLGLDELALNSNERLKLYQMGRPYR